MVRVCLSFAVASLATFGLGQSEDITRQINGRVNFPRGSYHTVINGTIGGESHDEWRVWAREGQRVNVTVLRGLPSLQPEFAHLQQISRNRWSGIAYRTGDMVFRLQAYPTARYRIRIEIR